MQGLVSAALQGTLLSSKQGVEISQKCRTDLCSLQKNMLEPFSDIFVFFRCLQNLSCLVNNQPGIRPLPQSLCIPGHYFCSTWKTSIKSFHMCNCSGSCRKQLKIFNSLSHFQVNSALPLLFFFSLDKQHPQKNQIFMLSTYCISSKISQGMSLSCF